MTSILRLPLSPSRLVMLVLVLLVLCQLLSSAAAAPVLLSVSGCALSYAQNTSGCHGGDIITLTGSGFVSSPPPLPVVGGNGSCSPVSVLSNSSILCVLPGPIFPGSWLSILLLQGNTTSNAVFLSYASSAPVVRSLSGCPSRNGSWSWNCLAEESVLTVSGAGFTPPLQVSLSNDFVPPYSVYPCANVTNLGDGNLTCSVPAVAERDSLSLLSVRVTSAGVTSSPFYGTSVNNRTQAWYPVIIGVTGCADGAASRCQLGDSVTIVGSQLWGDAVGYVGGRACQSSARPHASSIVCSLPALDDYSAWQPVQVQSRGSWTNVLYLGVKFALEVRLDSVFGCEGAAHQCHPGDVVSVHGQGFVQSPLTALVNGVPCSQTVWTSPQQLECALPDLGLSGRLLPLVVQSANMTSNALYVAYNLSQPASPGNASIPVSRRPVVFALSGCATVNGTSTFGCVAGGRLSIVGANFSSDATVQLIGPYVYSPCTNVSWWFDGGFLACTLPAVPQQAVGELLGVEVSSWSRRSDVFFGLTIGVRGSNTSTNTSAPPTPSVRSVRGCVQDGDSTLYCHAGQTLSVTGSNFSMPATVLLDGLYACNWVFLSDDGQTLSCSIPLLPESAVGRLLSVTVSCNNRSSAAFMGMSTLNSLSVTSVAALNGSCSRGANSVLFGCKANDSVVVYGSGFGPGPLTVLLSLPGSRFAPCDVTRLIDPRRVLCDLPAAPAMRQLLSVLVYSGNLYSAALPALLYGLPAPPVVTSISGCGPYQQQFWGCHQGAQLTVTGLSFFDPLTVALTSSRTNLSYGCGDAQLDFASGSITCTVPQVERIDNNASLLLTVQSVGGSSAASPSVFITTLGNLTMTLTAVTGCAGSSSGPAFNCYGGEIITLTGSGFNRGGQQLSVLVGRLNCSVYTQSDRSLQCVLPQVNDSALLGQWLPVEVVAQQDASNVLAAAVSYNAAVPALFSLDGCPRNRTSGCVAGGWMTVAGINLLNATSVLVERVPCAPIQAWSQMLRCQLPSLPPSYLERWLSLRVEISGGRVALGVPAAIRYAALVSSSAAASAASSGQPSLPSTASVYSSSAPPTAVLPSSTAAGAATSAARPPVSSSSSAALGPLILDSVSGCAVDINDGTSGCVAEQLITIVGSGFPASPSPVVIVGSMQIQCKVQDSTRMRCMLPDIDPSQSNQWMPISAQFGRLRERLTPGVRYAAISVDSTGSAAGGAPTGRFGLSLDELVLIVVAVSVVVGLLLVLQVMWCLTRCCGVALPCCSRLCPAARQSEDAHQEQEIHLGLLPNDQLVVHRQSPLPAASVSVPAASLAIAYDAPRLQHPVYPAAQQQLQPRPLLLPRSFVPSPEYYQ